MKTLIPHLSTRFRCGVMAIASLFISCEKPTLQIVDAAPAPPAPPLVVPAAGLPMRRTLTDVQGRSVDFTIVGRTNTELFIIRRADGMKASLAFDKLTPADRAFALGLPIQAPPNTFLESASGAKEEKEREEDRNVAYIQSREKEIQRLTEINLELESRMGRISNQVEIRSAASSIERNDREIERLKSVINNVRP